jgi:hypothetical protein
MKKKRLYVHVQDFIYSARSMRVRFYLEYSFAYLRWYAYACAPSHCMHAHRVSRASPRVGGGRGGGPGGKDGGEGGRGIDRRNFMTYRAIEIATLDKKLRTYHRKRTNFY